jgi:hypothetical protein
MLSLKKKTPNELEPPIALVLRVIVLKLKALNEQKGIEGATVDIPNLPLPCICAFTTL